ncbi:UDP-N-acetylmuramoyl-tripeptide--D-alanyl-D-alanine ligase [Hanstruepera flava]|uniref:UDP-N-acetylmuramoyl-tripeptide--D-alanyl-D- alanine ligase n=1 Tax=Hanstruepera flava TaxID=2930218 RepID=UPI00202783EA|nr:UDP-N-acetylmuramoyl-tripeptide--D-alanyl-D-alanine ligase [Hanstruepera flava]
MTIQDIHKLFLDCKNISTDTRKITKGDMFFALKGEKFNGNKFADEALKLGAKYVIIDEHTYKISDQTILVDNVLKTLQELATYHRNYIGIKIIALTGSNGKTTTKELINAVLSKKYNTVATKGNLNNHIGVPLTLLSMTKHTELGIVEMGANHKKEIGFLCHIALPDYGYITNFGKAHLEGFGGVEGVIEGKSEMYTHLIKYNKTIFVNTDDSIQFEKTKNAKTIKFGTSSGSDVITISLQNYESYVRVAYKNQQIQSQLIGDYNFGNIAAAIAIGDYFKVSPENIKQAIENYTPNNNRSQIIIKGTNKIILDAYNANPTSMEAALINFNKQKAKHKIVFLGDMFELGKSSQLEHQRIVTRVQSMPFTQKYFIGENFYLCKNNVESNLFFKSFSDFKEYYPQLEIKNSLLLIKGSRGMALERILDLLVNE